MIDSKKIDNLVHHYLGKIITTSGNFRIGFQYLKNSGNFYAISKTADRLVQASGAYYKYLYGQPLPETIGQLGYVKHHTFSNKLENELDWMLLSIRKFRGEIALFINYKRDFEHHFLLGEYTEAEKVLDFCLKDVGYSIWGLEARMLLHEYNGESDKAKMLMTDVLQQNKEGVFTSSLINFISQKVERKLSANKFDSDLKQALHNPKADLDISNRDYYNFHLNFFETKDFFELKDVLDFDFANPVADKYLLFRRMLHYCFCNGIELEQMLESIAFIKQKVGDDFFDPICLFSYPNLVSAAYFDPQYSRLVDLFYSGLYQDFIDLAPKYLSDNPSDFTIINLYARSLIFLGKKFTQPVEKSCVINEIAENIFKIYKRSSSPTEPLYNLYQISKNIDSFQMNYQLNAFIKKEQSQPYNTSYFFFSLPKADPKFIELFSGKPEQAEEIMEAIEKYIPRSIAFEYKLETLKGNYDSLKSISKDRAIIDKAIHEYEAKNYEQSLELFKQIYEEKNDIAPIRESAINYIFKIYFEKGNIPGCITWYVDNYIKNPFSVYKIQTGEIHKQIKKQRFKNIPIDIYLPVFISLISTDENEKSFAIELFCKSLDARLPSELLVNQTLEVGAYTELFLYRSCNNETLKHYRHISATKKRLEERIKICDHLAANYPENRALFVQELDLLTNELIIHEGTTKLDDSKIYANENAILSTELDELEGLYNRYMTIAGLHLKHVKIITVNKNELRYLNKKNETDYEQSDVEYSHNAHLDAFMNVFAEIRERFLFSKFGIVTYLSTRIRHGVLLGELRPELEQHKLIYFKNKLKDSYEIDPYWLNQPGLPAESRNALAETITEFSEKIDSFINDLIKDNIQITINSSESKAWFDYEFRYTEIAEYSIMLYYEDDYQKFCKKIMEILWERTDQNLEKIRNLLQGEVKTNFVNILNDFESTLKRRIGAYCLPKIFTSLNSCSTNLQNKIDKISSWFKRSGKKHSEFKIEPLINIICFSVQKSHPLKTLNPSINNTISFAFKGEFYEHFKDFLRIIIDNMLRHALQNEVDCKIAILEQDDQLHLILENNHASPEPEYAVMSGSKEHVQIDGLKLVTEGKSGLIKAKKILKDDLKDESNELYIFQKDGVFRVTAIINYANLIN